MSRVKMNKSYWCDADVMTNDKMQYLIIEENRG